MDLSGKKALVTGASTGIGAAVAKALAKAGAQVIMLARSQAALELVDDEIQAAGGQAVLVPLDLNRLEKVALLGPSIYENFGGLDILVANAGMLGPLTPVHQVRLSNWEEVFTVNFMANVRLIRTLDPLLRASETGRVVFTDLNLEHQNMAYWGPYMSSKAALRNFALVYAAETRQTNMRVNLVDPGVVDTPLLAEAFPGGYQGEVQKPEDVVDYYLRLCDGSCDLHGETLKAY